MNIILYKRCTTIFAMLMVFCAIPRGYAADYYVSTKGNDGSKGTSELSPWRTVKRVNSQAFYPGDSIHFRCGDFWYEVLTLRSKGTSEKPIIYTSYGKGEKPNIGEIYYRKYLGEATWNVLDSIAILGYNNHGIDIQDINNFTIKKCKIEGCNRSGIVAENCSDLLVEDTEILNTKERGTWVTNGERVVFRRVTASYCGIRSDLINQDGIVVGSGRNCIIDSCIAHHNLKEGSSGIDTGGNAGDSIIIKNCLTYKNGPNGISIQGGIDYKAQVINCISVDNRVGIDTGNECNVTISNNTIFNNSDIGINLGSNGNHVVTNNILWNNGKTNDGTGANISFPEDTSQGKLISDYNCIQEQPGANTIYLKKHGVHTFSEWRSFGEKKFDQHSINKDPLFKRTDSIYSSRYYELQKNSPAINAGNNDFVILETDYRDFKRIRMDNVDMGAIEYGGPQVVQDVQVIYIH